MRNAGVMVAILGVLLICSFSGPISDAAGLSDDAAIVEVYDFDDLVSAMESSGHANVLVVKSFFITGPVTVNGVKTLYSESNCVLTRDVSYSYVTRGFADMFQVSANAELTVGGGEIAKVLVLSGNSTAVPRCNGSIIWNEGSLTIRDGAVLTNNNNLDTSVERTYGGAVYTSGTMTIEGGTIQSCQATRGSGIYVEGRVSNGTAATTLDMTGGTLTNNGSAIWLSGTPEFYPTFNMYDGEITGNGVGVYVTYGRFYMHGGEITNNSNTSSTGGGGIMLEDLGSIIYGGLISGNSSTIGGGICTTKSFTIEGGTISNNNAIRDGGAIYIKMSNTMNYVTVNGGTITNNSSGIYVERGHAFFTGGQVADNGKYGVSGEEGSSLYIAGNARIDASNYVTVEITVRDRITTETDILTYLPSTYSNSQVVYGDGTLVSQAGELINVVPNNGVIWAIDASGHLYNTGKSESSKTISANPSSPIMGKVYGASVYVAYSEVTLTAVASVGYRFTEWSDHTLSAEKTFLATQDTTLVAYFEELISGTYGVYFNVGTSTDPVVPLTGLVSGAVITIPDCNDKKDGSEFIGWSDGNRTYAPGESMTITTHNVVLAPEWDEKSLGGIESMMMLIVVALIAIAAIIGAAVVRKRRKA